VPFRNTELIKPGGTSPARLQSHGELLGIKYTFNKSPIKIYSTRVPIKIGMFPAIRRGGQAANEA